MSKVERALSILRGSDSSFVQAWLAFFASIGLCVYGSSACEMSTAERKFFGLAVLFMVAQGFTLAKTYRDRELADLLAEVDGTQAVATVLRGTTAWFVQVVISFLVSVAFSFHTLLTAVGDADKTGDAGFAIYAASFALISTLSLAKAVRDRADAETLDNVRMPNAQEKFEKIMAVSSGSTGNFAVVVAGLLLSLFSTLGGVMSMNDEILSMERKGFVVIGILFLMTSAFHLAKLVRDLGDPVLAKDAHAAFRFLVVSSFAIACTISVGGVQLMSIPDPKKRFITNGLLFILSSTLSTAKLVRDRNEVAKNRNEVGETRAGLAELHQD